MGSRVGGAVVLNANVQAAEDTHTYPPLGTAIYALCAFMCIGLVAFLDRTILALLVVPIRNDLHISDTSMALLQGLAFVALFSISGLPIGWLADRFSRRNILLIGLAFWTLMTACCGLASSFGELFAARLGLGLGIAAYDPTVFSMIADYFPANRRSRAMSAVAAASGIGAGLSLVIGGLAVDAVRGNAGVRVPGWGMLSSWHLVLVAIALPGVLLACVLPTVREPARVGAAFVAPDAAASMIAEPSLLTYLRCEGWFFLKLFGLYACAGLASYAVAVWSPTLLVRLYGISAARSGLLVGPVLAAGGVAGAILGGIHADRLVASGWPDGRLRVNLLAFPIFIAGIVLSGLPIAIWVSLVGIFLSLVATSYSLAVGYSAVQELVPNRLRGQIVAVYSMNFNLIGLGVGPTAVAMATDYLFGRDAAIGYSMITVCVPVLCAGLILTLWALGGYRRVRAHVLQRVG